MSLGGLEFLETQDLMLGVVAMKMIRKFNLCWMMFMMGPLYIGIGIGTLDGSNEVTNSFYAPTVLGGVMLLLGIVIGTASGLREALKNTLESYDQDGSMNS